MSGEGLYVFWFIGSGFLFSSLRDTRGGQAVVSLLIAALLPWIPAGLIGAFFYQDLDELYLNILKGTLGAMVLFALWVILDPPDYLRRSGVGDRALATLGGLVASLVFTVFLGLSFFVSVLVAGPNGLVASTDSPTMDVFLESSASNPGARLGIYKVGDAVNCSSAAEVGAYGVYCDARQLRFNEGATDAIVDAMRSRSEPLLIAVGVTNVLAGVILILRPRLASGSQATDPATAALRGTGGLGVGVGNAFLFALQWLLYFIPLSLLTQIWAGSSASEGAGGGIEELLRWVGLFGALGFVVVVLANMVNLQEGGSGRLFDNDVRDRGMAGFAIAAIISFLWFISHAPPKPGWWFGGPFGALLGVTYGLHLRQRGQK